MAEKRAQTVTLDTAMANLPRAAALSIADVDLTGPALKALRESGIQNMNLVDVSGIRKAAMIAAAAAPPSLLPAFQAQLSQVLDEANGALSATVVRSTAARLSQAVDELNQSMISPAQRNVFASLDLEPRLREQVRQAPVGLPRYAAADFPSWVDATAGATPLTEPELDVESLDVSLAERFKGMSARERRTLALDLILLIAASSAFAEWLLQPPDQRAPWGVCLAVAWIVAVVRVRWRLAGKLG